MNKIWIDLTDIEKWQGQHGGVQRVVYGIAKNYYVNKNEYPQELAFFVFSEDAKDFRKADFEPIYERVEATRNARDEHVAEAATSKLKKTYKLLIPEAIRAHEPLRKAVKKTGKRTLLSLRSAKSRLTGKVKPISTHGESVTFEQGDTVLILGKPWDNLEIQKTLTVLKAKKNFKLVQVVYDLIIPLYPHLHHKSLFTQYTQHMFEAVASSDLMLPISESTDRDLKVFCDRLNLPYPKTAVIRLGDEVVAVDRKDIEPPINIKGDFIACVGTIEIRKNHNLLYYAYKLAAEKGIDLPTLLIVGGKGWLTHDIQYLIENDPLVKDKIKILTNINDVGLDWIYKNCLFTIYPSMYEGWGLPIAESLAYGKVCLSSNTSSMPEIAGDLIEYFSPFDANECLSQIVKYTNLNFLRKKENILSVQYKTTSWSDTYTAITTLLEQ